MSGGPTTRGRPRQSSKPAQIGDRVTTKGRNGQDVVRVWDGGGWVSENSLGVLPADRSTRFRDSLSGKSLDEINTDNAARRATDDILEVEEVVTKVTSTQVVNDTYTNTIRKIVFPKDLEGANSALPYVLIKIFETQTGSDVPITDQTSASFRGGVESAYNILQSQGSVAVTGAAVAGGVAGAAVTAFLTKGKGWRRGAKSAAGGAVGAAAGAALAEFGPDAAAAAADAIGQAAGVPDVVDRAKELIKGFALKRNTQQLETAIALLMPETLTMSNQNDYGVLSFTEATGAIGLVAQALGSNVGGATSRDPYIVEAAGRLADRFISEDFAKLGLFATTGRTLNPQLELIYNSPQLREFTLDFRLVPRSEQESILIRDIIKNIKWYGSPRVPADSGGRYIIPPAQFELEFYHSDQKLNDGNNFLFKTKKCVLEDISVDYTGSGTYATFWNGAPVEVRMSLRFKETVIIDRDAVTAGF